MLTLNQIIINHFVEYIHNSYTLSFGDMNKAYANVAAWAARLALGIIHNSDALYHNMEHAIMVTSVALEIIHGKHLHEGSVTPQDWLHFVIASVFHDIGYVKGICTEDKQDHFATGIDNKSVFLTPLGSDVTLTPYHVDRSKLFIRERFGEKWVIDSIYIDANVICSLIEMTRYPPLKQPNHQNSNGYDSLLRAADFIGQLGDPNYLNKTVALYYEYEELGLNKELGYQAPGDLRNNFAKFYWQEVSPYIQDALRYLRLTTEGKQWIANLHSHVFDVEHKNM